MFMFWISALYAQAQGSVDVHKPFDPSNMLSRVPIDLDSYYFLGGHQFYAMRFSYNYAIPNERHMMSITVPVVHNIFNGNFAGFENTTGIGDIHFTYMGVPYLSKDPLGLKKVAAYIDVSTPTGNDRLGRGVGTWVYKPGLIFTYQPDAMWYFFPEIHFQFSTQTGNTRAGSQGLPDLDDPDKDEKLQDFGLSLPTKLILYDWDGWIGLTPDFSYTFVEDSYYLFLRAEVGKMIGQKTAASAQLNRFVAGQPRLQTWFRVNFTFFLR
jgi:hypothetical protein